jgi:hypothetical protein
MELLSTLEVALAQFIEAKVQKELESRIAPFVDERIAIFLKARDESEKPNAATLAEVTQVIDDKLSEIWDDDIEDRVSRMIDTHVETEHDEYVVKDAVSEAFDKHLGDLSENTEFEKAVYRVIRDNISMRVTVD